MTRHLKPSRQHMLSVTNRWCEWQARHLRYIVERLRRRLRDSAYNIMWECDRCVHDEHNSNTTFNITRMRSQAWHINQHAEDDSWSNKWKEARHVEETHEITFRICTHACYWGQDNMTMKSSPANSTKRSTSEDALYLPYLPLRWSCIWWSSHAILIFSITQFLGPSPQLLGSDFNMSPFL